MLSAGCSLARHANEGGHNEENSMSIIEAAFVVNAVARLVTAVGTVITLIRRRRR
jgi:hypothetical protein